MRPTIPVIGLFLLSFFLFFLASFDPVCFGDGLEGEASIQQKTRLESRYVARGYLNGCFLQIKAA